MKLSRWNLIQNNIMLPPTPHNFILFELDFDVKFPLLRLLLFTKWLKKYYSWPIIILFSYLSNCLLELPINLSFIKKKSKKERTINRQNLNEYIGTLYLIPTQFSNLSIFYQITRFLRIYPLFFELSMYLSICLSVQLSIYLSVYTSICLSICLYVHLSIFPSVYLSICVSIHLSICPSVYLSICLSVYLSICLFVYLSICLSVYLSICLSVYLSICLFVYLSIYPSVYLYLCIYVSVYLYIIYLTIY